MSTEQTLPSLLVSASAGSGKTHFITTYIIELLLKGEDPRTFLTTTFTRKAAGEIFHRLISRLVKGEDDPSTLGLNSSDLPNIRNTINKLVLYQGEIFVSTIDSFAMSIAKAYFLELGLKESWRISEEWESKKINEEAILRSLNKLGNSVSSTIIALALRGKFPLRPTSRILSFAQQMEDAFLFSEKDSWGNFLGSKNENNQEEPLEKVIEALEASISTLDIKGRLLSTLKNDIENIKQENQIDFLCSTVVRNIHINKPSYYNSKIDESICKEIRKLIEIAKFNLAHELRRQSLGIYALLTAYFSERNNLIAKAGKLSFSDITRIVAEHARSLDMLDVYARLDSNIHHILIDEFQDTSVSQWEIFSPFCENIFSSNNHQSFVAVGDIKQSIYGWRGGASEIFDFLKKNNREIESIHLKNNYRSHPSIVSLVNRIFLNIENNAALSNFSSTAANWQKGFDEHVPIKTEPYSNIQILSSGEDEGSSKLDLVASNIAEIQKLDSKATIGILVRTNKQIEEIEEFLLERNISAATSSHSSLGDSYFAKIILSCLNLYRAHEIELSETHIKNCPFQIHRVFNLEEAEFEACNSLGLIFREVIQKDGLFHFVKSLATSFIPNSSLLEKERILKITEVAMEFQRNSNLKLEEFYPSLESRKFDKQTIASIQLMTIHGSKGLEFDHVILPYADEPFYNKAKISFLVKQESKFSEIKSVVRSVKQEVRDYFPDLNNMHEQELNRQVHESISLSYVALTRAIKGVTILLDPSRNAISQGVPTLAKLLRGVFGFEDQLEANKTLYSEICLIHSETSTTASTLNNIEKKVRTPKLPNILVPEFAKFKVLTRLSPSISSLETNKEMDLGTEVHKILAEIKWIDEDDDTDAVIKNIGTRLQSTESAINLVISAFQNQSIKELFNHNYQLNNKEADLIVYSELPFSLILNKQIFSGRIDRCVVTNLKPELPQSLEPLVRIHIIDFKTDLKESAESYLPQLKSYKLFASRRWRGLNPVVRTSLVFPRSGNILDLEV